MSAAGDRELPDPRNVHLLRRDDDPVDQPDERLRVPVAPAVRQALVDLHELQVHVVEQLDLALRRARELAGAEHAGELPRRDPTPEPPRPPAQEGVERHHNGPDQDRVRDGERGDWRDVEQHGKGRRPRRRPRGDLRQLVDREMAERPLVAVIKAEELRQHDPDREDREGPDDLGGARCRQPGHEPYRDEVGAAEHTTAERLPPEAPVVLAQRGFDGRPRSEARPDSDCLLRAVRYGRIERCALGHDPARPRSYP